MINVLIPCEDMNIIKLAAMQTLEEYNTYIFCSKFDGKNYARLFAKIIE